MMNRRFPWFAFSGVLLLYCAIQPAFAGTFFRLNLSNCSIASTGSNNEWKVSFTIQPAMGSSGASIGNNSVNNFTISVPTAANGTISRTGNRFVVPPPASSFNFPAGLAITSNSPSSSNITVGSSNASTPLVISSGGTVTFIISPTEANNAYPAAYIATNSQADNGSNASYGYYWFIPTITTSACTPSAGNTPPAVVPPISELNPIDPEFTMNSAEWMLQTTDLIDFPDVTSASTGYPVMINNINNNNLCVRYVTAGVTNKQYALAVTNSASSQGGRNLFTLPGPDSSQLFYNLQLASNDGNTANNFNFPATGTPNYITLGQTNNYSTDRSEMCWTPKINLFKNASTKEGLHSDTLNFIVIPKA
ncbi:hypothetical protein H8I91_07450 [Serratia fonticola]|uniref:hypothetical protein n=2 Tax=Serratia fonticola TaxID=47917 RepID=UPI00114067B6|nr:hypothetical protein [Serratia fonticola]MBC3250092.1 hypothetical protein [Serratia fonticola]